MEAIKRRKLAWIQTANKWKQLAKLQWTSQSHRMRRRPRNTRIRDPELEMGTAGFKQGWKKTEAAAEDRTGRKKVVCGLFSTGSDKA